MYKLFKNSCIFTRIFTRNIKYFYIELYYNILEYIH